MNIIKKKEFIELFSHKNAKSYYDFLLQANVKTSNGKLVPLIDYAKSHSISKVSLHKLYDNIIQRNNYLSRFYDTSLEPQIPLKITEKPMSSTKLNNNLEVKRKNIIRNIHLYEILQDTNSGFSNVRSFLDVLEDLYLKNIIDYKLLTPSAIYYMENGRLGSVFSSFYFRASIMNPYLVYSINKSILKGSKIFTPTLGWSSYCYGFLESGITEYVGNDVIPSICKKTKEFIKNYYPEHSYEITCSPSEDLLSNTAFLKKYKNHFDTVFFSPPYYRLELYSGKLQSTTRYKSYEDWLDGYWRKTIELCFQLLQKNGKICYIISNYGPKEKEIPLIKDMNNITEHCGFKKIKIYKMYNKSVTVNNQTDNTESICVFIKP